MYPVAICFKPSFPYLSWSPSLRRGKRGGEEEGTLLFLLFPFYRNPGIIGLLVANEFRPPPRSIRNEHADWFARHFARLAGGNLRARMINSRGKRNRTGFHNNFHGYLSSIRPPSSIFPRRGYAYLQKQKKREYLKGIVFAWFRAYRSLLRKILEIVAVDRGRTKRKRWNCWRCTTKYFEAFPRVVRGVRRFRGAAVSAIRPAI